MKKDFFTKKKIIIIGVVTFLIILTGSIFGIQYVRSTIIDNFNFSILPENMVDNEVETISNFLITSEKNYSEKALKKVISLSPDMEFSLDKISSKKYLLTPGEELKDNSIYNISISRDGEKIDKSWAFQTKTKFNIKSTMPADMATYVDVNTGIEILFSKPVSNIEGFFEITPNVNGSFEYRDRKVIFKPESLSFNTPYKVTINKGLKNIYDEELKEEVSFSFRTRMEKDSYFYLPNGFSSSFISSDTPSILMSLDDKYVNDNFEVNVYRLNNVEQYLNILEIHDKEIDDIVGEVTDYLFDLSKYTLNLRFSTNIMKNEEDWYYSLIFPESLEKGWYIADIKSDKLHFQKAIQVSDISVYTYGLNGDLNVWCNDSETGLVINGATVKVGDLASLTNKDGIAIFNLEDENKQKIIVTTKDDKVFGEYITLMNEERIELIDNYYTYLYTDRTKYFPTDTINFWGTIIPRKNGIDMPEKISVFIGEKEVVVEVNENGVFFGKASISNYGSTWLDIEIKVNEFKEYMSGVEIVDYIKPVYKINSEFSKDYYKKGEKIELNVFGSFYDGTSAENIRLEVESNGGNTFVTLDESGEGTATIKPDLTQKTGEIEYLNADVKVAGIDEESVSYAYTTYFPTDYYLSSDWEADSKKLMFSTNKVNYETIENGIVNYNEIYTGESFSQKVLVNIKEIEHVKIKTGENYNEYTGLITPTYRYDSIEKIIDTFNVEIRPNEKVEKSVYQVEHKDNYSYKAELVFTLPDGYTGYRELYLYTPSTYNDLNYYYTRDDGYKALRTGETVTLKLNRRDSNDFRMIYFVSTDRINKLGVTNSDTVNVTMGKEFVPNCLVTGAFFDGKHVYRISERSIYYDTSEKELDINITTDKENYSPREKVKAKISIKDKLGKPVKSEFVVSVVNETTLVDTINVDPLEMLYEERYHYPYTYSSHQVLNLGGEGGGGGGDNIREKFVDVLLFESLTTDEYGNANVEFETSDDLTSWRITIVAISKDINAGINMKNISTSIPFFINQVINDKYTENDDITFSARVFGNAIKGTKLDVEYEAKIDGMESKKLTIPSKETAMFNFGKMKPGYYKVTVTAKTAEYNDGITKEFAVLPSIGEVSVTELMNIEDIKEVNVVKYPAKFMFFDKNNGFYYKALMKVLEESNGMTSEQSFARNFAYGKLNEFFGEEIYNVDSDLILQDYDGGISKLPYSASDPLITANICKIAPDKVDKNLVIEYFYNIVNNIEASSYEVSSAYMGLASLKAPVLNEIKYLLDNSKGLEIVDKINLISGLAYVGDYDLANFYYDRDVKNIMKVDGIYKYIESEDIQDVYMANSRLLTILGIINHDDFAGVLNYVVENSSKEYISVLDLLVALENYTPISEVKSWMRYNLNGNTVDVDFSKEKLHVLTLDENDMNSFDIIKYKGEVDVIAEYIGKASELSDILDKVKIEKKITGGYLGEYSTVTLNIDVDKNCTDSFLITDYIPVSSRYTTSGYTYDKGYSYVGYEKQKVEFYINTKERKNFSISYKIRNVLTGEYMAESAIVVDSNGIISGKSNDLIFVVK